MSALDAIADGTLYPLNRRILREIARDGGSPAAGLGYRVGLADGGIGARLSSLRRHGLIERTDGPSHVARWKITPQGRRVLDLINGDGAVRLHDGAEVLIRSTGDPGDRSVILVLPGHAYELDPRDAVTIAEELMFAGVNA